MYISVPEYLHTHTCTHAPRSGRICGDLSFRGDDVVVGGLESSGFSRGEEYSVSVCLNIYTHTHTHARTHARTHEHTLEW